MKQKLTLILALNVVVLALLGGFYLYQTKQYDFKTLAGHKFQHSALKDDIIVVNYFAEWCAPCLREIPELNAFHQQAPQNVTLFAISYDNLNIAQLELLKKKYAIQFPIIHELRTPFTFDKPEYLPATFILGKDGQLVKQLLGEQTVASLNKAIAPLQNP